MNYQFVRWKRWVVMFTFLLATFAPILRADDPESLEKRSKSALEQLRAISERIQSKDPTFGAISSEEFAKFMRRQIQQLETEIIDLEKKVYEERARYNDLKQDTWRSFLAHSIRDLSGRQAASDKMNRYFELGRKREKEEEAKTILTKHKHQLDEAYRALKEARSELKSIGPILDLMEKKTVKSGA